MKSRFRRGEIYLASFGNVTGSEQGGTRPVLIIQNDIGNMFSPTTIVAAISSRIEKKDRLPTHVSLGTDFGLNLESFVMLEQVITIDKQRLGKHIGSVSDDVVDKINRAIEVSLGIH